MTKQKSGFTLIEVLVVILIISIVTGVALLTFSQNNNKKLQHEVDTFVDTVNYAESHAILKFAILGIVVRKNAWDFYRQNLADNTWVPINEKPLNSHYLNNGANLSLQNDNKNDESEDVHPQIIISTEGELTPFTLFFGVEGQNPRYAVKGSSDGSLTIQSLSEN